MADHEDATPVGHLRLVAEEVMMQLPAVEHLLQDASVAAAVNAGHSCGITYMSLYGVLTVASSDETANAVDELQYGIGLGPCLEALRTGTPVRVEDTLTETRWGSYPQLAAQAGVRSSLSYPIMLDAGAVGAINLYSVDPGPWGADQDAALLVLSNQVAGILHAVQTLAEELVRDPRAVAAFRKRHELDVAIGVVMAQHGCSSEDAQALIDAEAARRGAPADAVVADLLAGGALDESS
jgi:GAF domain-containing protein